MNIMTNTVRVVFVVDSRTAVLRSNYQLPVPYTTELSTPIQHYSSSQVCTVRAQLEKYLNTELSMCP